MHRTSHPVMVQILLGVVSLYISHSSLFCSVTRAYRNVSFYWNSKKGIVTFDFSLSCNKFKIDNQLFIR